MTGKMKVTDEMVEAASCQLLATQFDVPNKAVRYAIEAALAAAPLPEEPPNWMLEAVVGAADAANKRDGTLRPTYGATVMAKQYFRGRYAAERQKGELDD